MFERREGAATFNYNNNLECSIGGLMTAWLSAPKNLKKII
jgi:hypothetical protein